MKLEKMFKSFAEITIESLFIGVEIDPRCFFSHPDHQFLPGSSLNWANLRKSGNNLSGSDPSECHTVCHYLNGCWFLLTICKCFQYLSILVFVLVEWLDLFCSLVYFWSPSHAIIHFQLFCYVFFSNSALVSLPFINGVTRLQTSSCHKKDMKILRIIIFILVYGRICNKKSKEWGANIETKILPFSHSYFVHFWCKCVSWISKIMKTNVKL